jgi:deoxycytidine triphosphate deaminase
VIEMTVLSDKDIDNAMKSGTLGIEPFIEKNLTPNGYDLSIDEVYIKKPESHIKEGIAVIPPQTWFAISTKEFVKMKYILKNQKATLKKELQSFLHKHGLQSVQKNL